MQWRIGQGSGNDDAHNQENDRGREEEAQGDKRYHDNGADKEEVEEGKDNDEMEDAAEDSGGGWGSGMPTLEHQKLEQQIKEKQMECMRKIQE